ncbi:hypothetical protein BMW23_0401 [Bodo saltans virus]|uniref:Uncharacterized protein n=1 Tax=Bodo saltans virus TaxID=2024608 RepID=A0A2H4UUF6_9VIRU|nr:hypothetical protein QJ851_gp0392 [Bodo saltans virus]ATZ80455.1 hypothetical protein BMW23_0401 [Bodo saltans virus]
MIHQIPQKQLGKIPKYLHRKQSDDIIQESLHNIRNQNQNNDDVDNEKYDPYIDYLLKKGIYAENNKVRIQSTFINVDSRFRHTKPSLLITNTIQLPQNPLLFSTINISKFAQTTSISLLTINYPNNGLQKGQKFSLTGVSSDTISILPTYSYKDTNNISRTGYSAIFQEGSESLIILCDYVQSIIWNSNTSSYIFNTSPSSVQNTSFNPNFVIGDGISYDTLKQYDTSNMYVSLSGFMGYNGSTLIGNIPINFLNSTHQVYFINPNNTPDTLINIPNNVGFVSKITGFYIKLPYAFSNSNTPPSFGTNMVVSINFQYFGGIPLNLLNTFLPTTQNNISGYFTVYSSTSDTVSVILNSTPYYINPTPSNSPQTGQQPIRFGGNEVFFSIVSNVDSGYNNPNNYTIDLPETIHNVFNIKLKNTIIPNVFMTFRKNINDKLYWKNIDDGDYVYSVQINEGNYSSDNLAKTLQDALYTVPRQNMDAIIIDPNGGYSNKILFKISIDDNTNITSFKSYKEALLRQPIQSVLDSSGQSPSLDPTLQYDVGDPPYTIQIRHPTHNLSIGNTILLQDFCDTYGIPANILNTTHTINNVIDNNTYEIVIDNFNLTYPKYNSKGGFAAKVYVPNQLQLLFNRADTIGNELGFRNVGDDLSITNFSTTITNNDPYFFDNPITDPDTNTIYVTDGIGQQLILTNNALQLANNDYLLMTIREFAGCQNIGTPNIKNYFAKINLALEKESNGFFYDTFISAPVTLYDMISLKSLTISFYDSKGNLYDFNNVEHSFVLEVLSMDNLPEGTGINTKTSM